MERPGLGRRARDPRPQDDRAGGRAARRWRSTTSSKTSRRRPAPLRRRDQPGRDGRARRRPLLLRRRRRPARDARRPARPAGDRRADADRRVARPRRSASAGRSPAGLWCFPVETVSQSEAGFEGVYQSSAVIPHWVVTADASRRWEVRIRWTSTGRGRRAAADRESATEDSSTADGSIASVDR